MPYLPYRLTERASLNRVRIPGHGGATAGALLSRAALMAELRQRIAFAGDDEALLRAISAGDGTAAGGAAPVLAERGARLAELLLALHHGQRDARPGWDAASWAFWADVREVVLGGGLMSGALGAAVAAAARRHLKQRLCLEVAAHPAILPLLGAARHLTIDEGSAVVLDGGGTTIKRARATVQSGMVVALDALSSLPAGVLPEPGAPRGGVAALAARLATAAAEVLQPRDAAEVIVSIASYVVDGVPCSSGGYGSLRNLAPDPAAALGRRISAWAGKPVRVTLIHDGTAAAAWYAGRTHTTVLMMGTWLGVGVPPPDAGLRPIADDVRIRSSGSVV